MQTYEKQLKTGFPWVLNLSVCVSIAEEKDWVTYKEQNAFGS